jgi:uncharacterized protein YjbI with pentapeptide repeats
MIMNMWKASAIALAMSGSPALTQNAMAQTVAFAPPANSCLVSAGPLKGNGPQAVAVDGATLKDASDVKSLRSKAKDGRLIVINGGDFTGQKFGSDNFSNICFIGTKFVNTRWSKSRASGIGFINADLTGATFDRVQMDFVLLRNTVLARTDASGAQMSYGQFDGGWEPSIAGLRLENANMTGFKFICGVTSQDGCAFDRKQISLRGANLRGGSIYSFSIWDAALDDVQLNNTEISLDQITQFAGANVTGPVLIRAENKRATLAPDVFRLAAGVISIAKTNDTECNNPDSALSQIFCRAGYADLRAYRDDVNRLYESTLPKTVVANTAGNGSSIVVSGGGKIQNRYLTAMRRCALKDDEQDLVNCLQLVMSKRRDMLVAELMTKQPLAGESRALYVSAQTPYIQTVMRDPRLASLTPLLVDSSPNLLLAYRDENMQLVARGYAASQDGQRCPASFAQAAAGKKKRSRRGPAGPSFAAWTSGAEFTLGQPAQPAKKKRKPRKKKGQAVEVAVATPAVTSGCTMMIKSGPLVRVPVSEDDFDKLWVLRPAKS